MSSSVCLILLSPFIGSFLGLLAWRLPLGQPIISGRSLCPCCKKTLDARSLVPLLSYVIQKGRCRSCNAMIDAFHPLMELATLTVTLSACYAHSAMDFQIDDSSFATMEPSLILIGGCVFGWILLTLAAIDLRSYRLPNCLTFPLIVLGLAMAANESALALTWHMAAAFGAWGGMTLIAIGYQCFRGRTGLGAGDAKLLAAGGAMLGPVFLPQILFVSATITLVAALLSSRGRLTLNARVPFGPGLALSLWGGWLWEVTGHGGF